MDLKEIATISGRGGLFKVMKPTRTGVILESIDEKKQKIVANIHHKVSLLDEISIYTHSKEGSLPLIEVFRKIYGEFSDDPGVDGKSSKEELISFMKYILPDFDESRVYPSNIKKLISWYLILVKNYPELFEEQKKEGKVVEDKEDVIEEEKDKEKEEPDE